MVIKLGPFEIETDFSSSETSLASSTTDEEKKMKKKIMKGKDAKYKPKMPHNYEPVVGQPQYKKKGAGKAKTATLPPPPPPVEDKQVVVPQTIPENVGKIDESMARAALLKFVDSNACYGKAPAQQMELLNIKLNCAYYYKLETFTEARKIKWKTTGYEKGKVFDAVETGEAPQPWDVPPPKAVKLFDSEKEKMEVPKTASVKKCWYCKAGGQVKCAICKGAGVRECNICHGTGKGQVGEDGIQYDCLFCGGSAELTCVKCFGAKSYKCKVCSGKKKLKWFVQLTMKWKNNVAEYVEENTELPDSLVRQVKGEKIFEDVNVLVKPLDTFPVPVINRESARLVAAQQVAYPQDRILQQRHTVTVVPVNEVEWRWKDGGSGTFIIYGLNNQVWFPDYPAKCCCSIV